MWVLERCDPARNMARFYVLVIEPTLFGDTALLRRWGRIGTHGRERRDLFQSDHMARESLGIWLERKKKRGYGSR